MRDGSATLLGDHTEKVLQTSVCLKQPYSLFASSLSTYSTLYITFVIKAVNMLITGYTNPEKHC